MSTVLLKAASFALIIMIGAFMRRRGIVGEDAGRVMEKITLNVTLPCAIITSFSQITDMSATMLVVVALGLVANVIMMLMGDAMTKSRARGDRAMYMLCLPAFNIGAFGLPFVQTFLPPLGTAVACMFDAGNSFMCTGGTFAYAGARLDTSRGIDIRIIFRRLFRAIPFDTYTILFVLALMDVHLPDAFVTLVSPMANANAFCAMLMIGFNFHLEMRPDYLRDIMKMTIARHIFAVALALIVYFLLPFDLVTRQTLVLLSFTPMSAISPAFTRQLGGDPGKASAANSLTIILSVIELTLLLILMGIY